VIGRAAVVAPAPAGAPSLPRDAPVAASRLVVPSVVLLLLGSSQVSAGRLGRLVELDEGQVAFFLNVVQYAPAALLAAWALHSRRSSAVLAPWMVLGGVLAVSATWSLAPLDSLQAGLLTALTGLVAARAAQLSTRSWLVASTSALALVVVASLYADLVLTDNRYDPVVGLFDTRNELARHCAFTLVVAVGCAVAARGRAARVIAVVGIVSSGWGLWISESATALIAVVVAAAAATLPTVVRRTSLALRVVLVAWLGPLAGAVAVTQTPAVLALLGRDASLTGRTQIWALAFDALAGRPALGYGADAFWTSSYGDRLRLTFGDSAIHAHNAWIDLVLALGVLGGSVVTVLLVVLVVRGLGRGAPLRGALTHLLVAVLALQLSYSLSESALVRPMFGLTIVTLVLLIQHGNGRRRA